MRVSVALCTFNGERFLPAQLASLRAQTLPPCELVARDDGSTDGTVPLLEAFARTAPFPVRIAVNPLRLGSTANFERAFRDCTGDVIAPCDQDDEWLPGKLARFADAFADPGIGLAFADAWLADAELNRTGRTAWANLPFPARDRQRFNDGYGPRVLLRYNVVTGAAMAFRANLRRALLPVPTGWVQDAWIAFVASAISGTAVIPEPLIVYRRHANQQIGLPDRTLARQVRTAATARGAAHFRELAAAFDALAERLETLPVRDGGLAALVRAKAAFARERAALRGMDRVRRTAAAAAGFVRGDYGRFARGWKAFAADVALG